MIELTLLGLQAVRSSDGRELGTLTAQPQQLALLAYLAASGSGELHRTDTLAAMFWPALDQSAARRALRKTLFHLREALGDGAIIARGDDALTIDPALVTCDVSKLESAVAEGRFEEAVELYRGELLAGIQFANESAAFEEWLSKERTRLTALVVRATRELVDRTERAGNIVAAADWARRACALSPGDETCLRRAMSLHDAAGDHGGALRLYDSYARHISIQFDTKPSAASAALAARIRAGTPRAAGGSMVAKSMAAPPPAPSSSRQRSRARWTLVLGAAIATVAAIALLFG